MPRGADYEASMHAAAQIAEDKGWILLSDSSWPGYTELPHRLMEGYLVMAAETAAQMDRPPTHIFLQAGVGGLAAACAAYFRSAWQDAPEIYVVDQRQPPPCMMRLLLARWLPPAGLYRIWGGWIARKPR